LYKVLFYTKNIGNKNKVPQCDAEVLKILRLHEGKKYLIFRY